MALRPRQAGGPSGEGGASDDVGEDAAGVNEVRLVGRVNGAPQERVMPSGDVLVSLRLVVPREPPKRPAAADRPRAGVDTIDVACWSATSRRAALRLEVGDRVEVSGALRRRFFRAGAVALSRYEVEAVTLTRQAQPTSRRRKTAAPAATATTVSSTR